MTQLSRCPFDRNMSDKPRLWSGYRCGLTSHGPLKDNFTGSARRFSEEAVDNAPHAVRARVYQRGHLGATVIHPCISYRGILHNNFRTIDAAISVSLLDCCQWRHSRRRETPIYITRARYWWREWWCGNKNIAKCYWNYHENKIWPQNLPSTNCCMKS